MRIPFWTATSDSTRQRERKRDRAATRTLFPRKGGGGGGRGGGGSSGSGRGSSGSGTSGGSSAKPSSVPLGSAGGATGGRSSATAYGSGGGRVSTIPSGQLFAGRSQGGGSRDQVVGTQTYGSGYPGRSQRGVSGLGFPFFFWPVTWGAATAGGVLYLHDTEYGDANNSSRPGGILTTTAFSSNSTNTTLHIVADNATTTSLMSSITSNCTAHLSTNTTGSQLVQAFNTTNTSMPQPEQAVQYYRASSITLTLDGYNDTTALNASAGVNDTHTPLPSWADNGLLDCVNQTISQGSPLIDGAMFSIQAPSMSVGSVAFIWFFFFIAHKFI